MENPRLILEQNIRELNDQVPKMNENIATVKANAILLQKETRRLQLLVEGRTSKVKAALQLERDDLAKRHAIGLQSAQDELTRAQEQLKLAEAAYEKAQHVKKAFMREREKKIQEAQTALRAHEHAKWQAEVADTLQQFEVGGIDQTHDEMIRRIEKDTAQSEGRMEMALDSVDAGEMGLDEEAESIQAEELLRQFKLGMGLQQAHTEAPPSEQQPDTEVPQKTIGRDRTS